MPKRAGLALVLVEAVDRRVLPALALTPQLSNLEPRALHIAFDFKAAQRLARDWMELAAGWVPLQIEEPTQPTLAACVRSVVEREVSERTSVTVIVPEMDLNRWWQPLLHRGTGRSIAWELHGLRSVTSVVVPVRVETRVA
ncbi:MAG TPA: hypothetical protein VMY88_06745 [Acidimicrobiales bacterium]|nr:hypothetical protein [Acidimicrobiales bacterium]